MAVNPAVLESTGNVLLEFLQTNDRPKLIENIQNLIQKEEANEFLNNLKQIIIGINEWNIEEVQSITDQISSKIEDSKFKNILKVFQRKLILLLLDQIIEKTDDIELKIQTLLNKIPILTESYILSQKINDALLTKSIIEGHFDNFTILGLFSLYSGNIQNALHYFGNILDLSQKNEEIFPSKYSFILRLLSNLLLKIRFYPELLNFSKNALNLDPDAVDPYQIAFKFLKQAISTDEKANKSPDLALDYYNMALLYNERKMFDQAIHEINKAHKIHEDLGDKVGIINDLILLGTLTSKINQNDKALILYHRAMNIAVDIDLRYKIAQLNLLISNILRDKQNYDESLKYLKTSLVIFKQEQMGSDIDLIAAYTKLGSLLRAMEQVDTAKAFLEKILEVEKKSESKSLLMEIHSQLAITYAELGNQDEFTKNYHELLSLSEKVRDPLQYAHSEYQLGVTFYNLQKFKESLNHLGRALKISHKLKNLEKIQTILQTLSLVYLQLNQQKLAGEIVDENQDIMTRSQSVIEKSSIKDLEIPEISTIPAGIVPSSKPEPPVATPKITEP
ncbi:MAG: tetratricopeptide repeat protein, partial [Candidatus Helarchaeota archaeon]|nr:tetratricopeptide repeat protein [Candidatus Helarchaeota archaeon]